MHLEITLQDGTKLFPSFDPAHTELVKTAYANLFKFAQIKAYVIRDNNRQIIAFNN